MYKALKEITHKPKPFEFYTAESLWTDPYRAKQMLNYHLNNDIEAASRNMEFIDKSVAWITKHLNLSNNASVIDFGCGPGFYTTRMAKKGFKVTGLDFSQNSIDYAQNEAITASLSINYICQNYLQFDETDKYDLATLIMCDFGVLSPKQRKQLLNVIYKSLKPGGKLLLDVYSLAGFDQKQECAIYERNQLFGFWSEKDYFTFVNTFKYQNEKLILDKYTVFEEQGKTFTIYNWFQYFSLEGLTNELKQAGFSQPEYFADVSGTCYGKNNTEFAVIVTK